MAIILNYLYLVTTSTYLSLSTIGVTEFDHTPLVNFLSYLFSYGGPLIIGLVLFFTSVEGAVAAG